MIIRTSRLLIFVLFMLGARAAAAQCYQNPTGGSAVGLQNSSSYFLTFYVDGVNKGGVPSGDKSIDFVVSAGQHNLVAVAVIGGETSAATRSANVTNGYVCTWTVTDPPPRNSGLADRANAKDGVAANANKETAEKGKGGFGDILLQLETITVTGYIRDGVECFVFESLNGGQKFSVMRSNKLQIGKAYRITGPVFQIGFCQQGFPTLGVTRVQKVKGR